MHKTDDTHYAYTNDSKDCYITQDLGLASALCSRNYQIVTLDKRDPRKVAFVFKRELGIEEDADAYWSDELETKCRSYFENLRNLKNRLHSSE